MAADHQPPSEEPDVAAATATSSPSTSTSGSTTPTSLVLQRARRLLRQQAPVAVVLAELRRLHLESGSESESESGGWTAWEVQGLVHAAMLADPLHETFPLAADYRARFVRRLCTALEEEGAEEVAEPFLKELNALLLGGAGGGLNVQPDSYVAYECPIPVDAADGAPARAAATATLVCRVAPRENQVGLKLWEACFVLADHLLSRDPGLCRGAHVVELGAGVGLLGLVAARCLGAARVTLTDADVEVLKFLRHNVQANESAGGGDGKVEVASLDWAEPVEYQALLQPQHQQDGGGEESKVILAADCIYDLDAIPAFVFVLAWALRADPATVVLVASTLRNPETYALFEGEVEGQGLVMESVGVGAGGEEGGPFAAWWVEGEKGRRWRYESPFYCPNRGAVRLCRIRLRE